MFILIGPLPNPPLYGREYIVLGNRGWTPPRTSPRVAMGIAPLKGHESIFNTFSKGPFRPYMGGSLYYWGMRILLKVNIHCWL